MATTTKVEQRAAAKAQYDTFLAVCPSRQLLDQISDKWVVLVLCALGGEGSSDTGDAGDGREPGARTVLRCSELARQLAGVSQKMLTQTLRSLERDGLLTRTVTPTVPVTVAYELTDLGRSLHQMARGMRSWAPQDHMDDVLAHRKTFDTRTP